ncbi:MAG: hypothetical protein JXR37_20980 [Kiritimatiellae bacterium]|nr:hypothetical protein [Kiritimatiellia bacterium]
MKIRKLAKDTLTAVEMEHGQTLEFTLLDGSAREIVLESTHARIVSTTLSVPKKEEDGAMTVYRFGCRLNVDGEPFELEREVPTQRSFYEPWLIHGMHVWLDAVDAIFEFLLETHGHCRPSANHSKRSPPRKHARFALQDATARICPVALHPWCPLPEGGLRIEQCYRGEDCWLGPYNGASAHGGLDINHPKGTPLWAPIAIHDQFYFNSLAMGHNNNRWRGIHRWPNGAEWILQAHHMTRLTVPEHKPLAKGQQYADGAGVLSGAVDHSHFMFKIHDEGETILLDPWILFWQMYHDVLCTPDGDALCPTCS